jgi:hypothetical protein
VQVSAGFDDPELAARDTVVDDSGVDVQATDLVGIGIWVEELGESVIVQPRFLRPTGDRRPAPRRQWHCTAFVVLYSAGRASTVTHMTVFGQSSCPWAAQPVSTPRRLDAFPLHSYLYSSPGR